MDVRRSDALVRALPDDRALNMPKRRGTGGPYRAEDCLDVAVDVA